ncbi:jg1443 [Pararge aegeria aegeria]|uniref:Jg1443 protein n=1 Tax=Pararge aegeria aegeria TaxID=348720 RepID=A0A8S4SPP9_9NEOP|nr:jg1443 [Pararge aegeria aegeria]
MRRGHSGIGGWRSENPRHFRPRIGGNPHFRPPKSYGILETPRFPPPFDGSRSMRFNNRSDKSDRTPSVHSDRYRFRSNQNVYQRPHQQGERRLPSSLQWTRQTGDSHRNTSIASNNYYEDQPIDQFHPNRMSEIDKRHIPQMREVYKPPLISPWEVNHPLHHSSGKEDNVYRHDRGHPNKPSAASMEYTGHRPPASDHYGCNPTSVIDSTNTFSRSVDATVDLVRKRLLNRSDPQNTTDNFENCQDTAEDGQKSQTSSTFRNNQNEQPLRKKYQRQRHTDKSSCDKIRSKIVHQLFKMDKEKIHKLMDNPNSSTKFEYAISSLITESQNSFNRHLRSAAEKTLCGSSTDFIENDNNTIYEDTFMKQMQCMLDPQDTVFLEDIKPFVMAEITKVLQLNEYDQNVHIGDDGIATNSHDEHQNYNLHQNNNNFNHEEFSTEDIYSGLNNISPTGYQRPKSVEPTTNNYGAYEDNLPHYGDSKHLFDRRHRTKSFSFMQGGTSEINFYGRELGDKPNETITGVPQDLFDSNGDQLSEDEDPFAELDKQYHVAVDHDFIEQDDILSPKHDKDLYNSNSIKTFKVEPLSPDKNLKSIDKDIEKQIFNMAQSPLKLSLPINNTSIKQETKEALIECKEESLCCSNILSLEENNGDSTSHNNDKTNKQYDAAFQEITKQTDTTDLSSNLKSPLSNPRKRSIDQRPSHRKEKRKKSESESSKQILNKNIIINVNDCASKSSDKCETSKPIFNLFFSKEQSKLVPKDNKTGSNDKNYTEKHVKRKETPKRTTEKNSKRKDSTSSTHLSSPTENSHINNDGDTNATTTTSSQCDNQTKSETKTILKPIDMFNENPKKTNLIHQAHRNTAPTPSSTSNIELNKKSKLKGPLCKQLMKRHIAIQVIRKMHAKQTQTPPSKCGTQSCQAKKKYATKSIQTDVNIPDKTGNKSNDAFERMKEIDLEIQVLLQEKFKLYSSIESKDTGTSSMQTLGMTVLNVSPYNGDGENETTEDSLSEDTIVNDFANIPVEELEQIALETVQEDEDSKSNQSKRFRRRKVPYEESHSQSPVTVQKRKKSKPKSPNISLIEQIITNEGPIEDDITLLDDSEIPEMKSKNKNTKRKKKGSTRIRSIPRRRIVKPTNTVHYTIKECSVVIERIDITPYRQRILSQALEPVVEFLNIIEEEQSTDRNRKDVSEDIVVGDNCEVKSLEDKEEITENENVAVCEEIILDNSQSSMEDATTPAMGQGGECKMYDYSADENLRRDSVVVSGNADAVLALECVESNFLAACLDGNVYYFNNDGQLLSTLRGSNLAVTCITIVKEKYGTTVYTGSLDSRIRYYDLETGLEKGLECNFECKNNMLIPVSSVKFSDQSILALRAMKEGPRKVLLVAARSENVTIKDAQTGLLLRTLVGPKMTVYSLLFEDGKVFCGTSSHQIHVFDYASGTHAGTHSGGKGAVCLRATGGLLFAGCYDGCVYVYRESEGEPFAQIRGPSLMLLSLAVVGSKIIAGYKDRSLYIWKIPLCILQEMIL